MPQQTKVLILELRTVPQRADFAWLGFVFRMEMLENITANKSPVDYQKKLFCHASF